MLCSTPGSRAGTNQETHTADGCKRAKPSHSCQRYAIETTGEEKNPDQEEPPRWLKSFLRESIDRPCDDTKAQGMVHLIARGCVKNSQHLGVENPLERMSPEGTCRNCSPSKEASKCKQQRRV